MVKVHGGPARTLIPDLGARRQRVLRCRSRSKRLGRAGPKRTPACWGCETRRRRIAGGLAIGAYRRATSAAAATMNFPRRTMGRGPRGTGGLWIEIVSRCAPLEPFTAQDLEYKGPGPVQASRTPWISDGPAVRHEGPGRTARGFSRCA